MSTYHIHVRVMLVIGLCNTTVKGTVNMSCLCQWTECVMFACCCPIFCRVTRNVAFFSWKPIKYVYFLSQILSYLWLIDNRTLCHPTLSVIIPVINKSDPCFVVVQFCFITPMMKDQRGLHLVLLPLLISFKCIKGCKCTYQKYKIQMAILPKDQMSTAHQPMASQLLSQY